MKDIDISLTSFDKNNYDLSISNGDFTLDSTIKSPFLTSLYTNLRVIENGHDHSKQDDYRIALNKAGYWANSIKEFPQGSLLWNYEKARRNSTTAQTLKKTCEESLKWLNKNIEVNYILEEDKITLNYKVPGEEQDFNFEERF